MFVLIYTTFSFFEIVLDSWGRCSSSSKCPQSPSFPRHERIQDHVVTITMKTLAGIHVLPKFWDPDLHLLCMSPCFIICGTSLGFLFLFLLLTWYFLVTSLWFLETISYPGCLVFFMITLKLGTEGCKSLESATPCSAWSIRGPCCCCVSL